MQSSAGPNGAATTGIAPTSIAERDIPELADIANPGQIPRLLQLSARFAGQLINLSEFGRTLGLDHKTFGHYLHVLEQIYLL